MQQLATCSHVCVTSSTDLSESVCWGNLLIMSCTEYDFVCEVANSRYGTVNSHLGIQQVLSHKVRDVDTVLVNPVRVTEMCRQITLM